MHPQYTYALSSEILASFNEWDGVEAEAAEQEETIKTGYKYRYDLSQEIGGDWIIRRQVSQPITHVK